MYSSQQFCTVIITAGVIVCCWGKQNYKITLRAFTWTWSFSPNTTHISRMFLRLGNTTWSSTILHLLLKILCKYSVYTKSDVHFHFPSLKNMSLNWNKHLWHCFMHKIIVLNCGKLWLLKTELCWFIWLLSHLVWSLK